MIQTRLLYLEKVIDQTILPYMSKNSNKKTTTSAPPAPTASGAEVIVAPAASTGSSVPDIRTWKLAQPRMDVPTTTGLKRITAEVLDADPALLAWLAATYPDCFTQLPDTHTDD